MDEQQCVLGVDLGTTSIKAIAFAMNGSTLASSILPVTTVHQPANSAEQDPQAIVMTANQVLLRATAATAAQGYRIAAVGLSAAMHSLLALNEQAQPLGQAIIWMDNRASRVADDLWQTPQGQALYERTGTPIHAMTPLAKLLWLRQQQPERFQQARRFVSLKEWLWHQWFGVWEIDVAQANATGLYNLYTRTWDAEALAMTSITAEQLSAIVPITHTRNQMQDSQLQAAGITPTTAFTIGASDGVLANIAANALDASSLTFTVGTSCAIRTGVAQPMTDRSTRMFCYTLNQNHYIVGGPSNSGGNIVEWLNQQLCGGTDATLPTLLAAAATVQDDGLLCLPYVAGERAPLWDEGSSATFHGLRLAHTSAHLLRAAIEGIIFNAYWIAEGMMQRVGQPQQVIVSGRVLEEAWVQQLVADVFGLPVIADSSSDASALGAAKVALVAAGSVALAAPWGIERTAQPLLPKAHADYQAKYQRFRQLCSLLHPAAGASKVSQVQ